MKPLLTLFLISVWVISACNNRQPDQAYLKELEAWHAHRVEKLKAEDGWLNLAGLFWLNEGESSFGSDSSNAIVFTHPDMPPRAGVFERKGNLVRWISAPGARTQLGDSTVQDLIMSNPHDTVNHRLSLGSLRWNIILREDKAGIRLRDLQHPALKTFNSIERFPTDPSMRLKAKLVQTGADISFQNVLGQTITRRSPGRVIFQLEGKEHALDALYEEEEGLLVVFGDATSAVETYGGGRFVYVSRANETGETIIDFNKAHNPPCAFTVFATCPLPPRQNILPVAVKAGEKYGKKNGR